MIAAELLSCSNVVWIVLVACALATIGGIALLDLASRPKSEDHVSPMMFEYVEAMQSLSAEHAARTGHSWGAGTADRNCSVCAFIGGDRETTEPGS